MEWTVAFSFAVKESLRNGKNFESLTDLLSEQELEALKSAVHMPLFAAGKIALLIQQAGLSHSVDGFAFTGLEGQRILLIDYLGGCERILKTPRCRWFMRSKPGGLF